MNEFCPLRKNGIPELEIPEVCDMTCSALWDQALREDQTNGEYDYYGPTIMLHDADCKHNTCDVQFSDSAVKSLGKFTREYTIVDEYECGVQLGEQNYAFTCPLPIEEWIGTLAMRVLNDIMYIAIISY